jgi:hypothetical protein
LPAKPRQHHIPLAVSLAQLGTHLPDPRMIASHLRAAYLHAQLIHHPF